MAQSLAKVYLHVVFSTKHREPVLADDWREELFCVLGGIANNQGCQSLIVGGVADHVHLLFELARTITIAETVGQIKSNSSAWINQTRQLPVPFNWQGGYGAFSVSKSNVEAVREYIRTQPEHHANRSYQDEFLDWLQRYEIVWDERYVWDCTPAPRPWKGREWLDRCQERYNPRPQALEGPYKIGTLRPTSAVETDGHSRGEAGPSRPALKGPFCKPRLTAWVDGWVARRIPEMPTNRN